MIDIKEEELLNMLFELTHIKNEEGEDVPNFCFASDIVMDIDAKEEDVAIFALKNGYKVFKVFPGETIGGGLVLVADGATIEPVSNMYKEFYGEVPEIVEMELDEDENLKEVVKETEEIKEEVELDLESQIRSVLDYEKTSKDSDGGKPYLFEIDDASERASKADGDPFWIKRFDDEVVDFSKLQVHNKVDNDGLSNPPVASFMITGGCNGCGTWDNYLSDLKTVFEELKKVTGCDPLLYQIDTDIADDVWTGFVFMYDNRDDSIEESIEMLDEALTEYKHSKTSINKIGDPNAKAMWGRTRHQVETPKKGKGSFKRKDKHGDNYELDEVFMTPDKTDVDEFIRLLNNLGYTVEPIRKVSLFRDDESSDIHIQIYANEEYPHLPSETASMINERHKEEITAKYEELARAIEEFDEKHNNKYRITYSIGFGGHASDGTDCTARISAGIDMRAYWVDPEPVDISTNEDLDIDAVELTDEDRFGDYKSYMDKYIKHAAELGAKLEFKTKVGPKRLDSCWYGDGNIIATINYKDYFIEIYSSGNPIVIEMNGEEYQGIEQLEDLGIYNDETFPDSNEYEQLDCPFLEFNITKGENTLNSYEDLYFDSMWEIPEALDIESYINQVIPAAEPEITEALTEKKSKKRKHKKGSFGWFCTLNPGNVEKNIQHFNHVNNAPGAESTITAPADIGAGTGAGLGEDIDFDELSPYVWEFNLMNDYTQLGYNEQGKRIYYAKIPETCLKVSKENYKENKLLKMRKNREVLKGVTKFFEEHPGAKWCIIGCKKHMGDYDKYVNAYRILIEESTNGVDISKEKDYNIHERGTAMENKVTLEEAKLREEKENKIRAFCKRFNEEHKALMEELAK